jgi:hypothetical protein
MSRKHLQGSNGNISSFPGCGLALLIILATLAAMVPGPAGPSPAAANDDPVISGNAATYSGNQQPNPITQNNTNIYTINVQNLTTNVGSSSTGTSISLTNTGAAGENDGDSGKNSQALSLNYSGGNNYLYGDSYGAYVNTTGGAGHSGKNNKSNQDGGDGGAGGTAGTVTNTSSGNIQVGAQESEPSVTGAPEAVAAKGIFYFWTGPRRRRRRGGNRRAIRCSIRTVPSPPRRQRRYGIQAASQEARRQGGEGADSYGHGRSRGAGDTVSRWRRH